VKALVLSCSHEWAGGEDRRPVGFSFSMRMRAERWSSETRCGGPGTPKSWRLLFAVPLPERLHPRNMYNFFGAIDRSWLRHAATPRRFVCVCDRHDAAERRAITRWGGASTVRRFTTSDLSSIEGRGSLGSRGDVSSIPGILFWPSPLGTSQAHSVTLTIQAKQFAGHSGVIWRCAFPFSTRSRLLSPFSTDAF